MKFKVIYTKLNRHRFMKELLKRSVLKRRSSKTCPLGLRCLFVLSGKSSCNALSLFSIILFQSFLSLSILISLISNYNASDI